MHFHRNTPANGVLAIIALCALLVFPAPMQGQEQDGTVTGRVLSVETEQPLATISVVLRTAGDSTRVALVTSRFDGTFRIPGVEPGRYFLEISGIGQATRETELFEVARGVVYDFGTVLLSTQAIALDPITVESERAAVSYEADRTSYAVDALPGAEGGVITDALKNIPDVDVDIDGNIEVRGERPAIWVDGRPAPVTGQSLTQFLEQFPADLLDRIEVLDNPGAEYDAEGPGGIVNIVMKEGVDLGISGSVFANGGTRGNTGVGGRATIQRGDWVHNGNLSLRRTDSEVASYNWQQNLATSEAEIVERDSWNDNESLGASVGLRSTWSPRDEARINFRFDYGAQSGKRDGLTTTTHRESDEQAIYRFDRSALADSDGSSLSFRTDFQWQWEPRQHELDAEIRLGRGHDARSAEEEILSDEEVVDEIAFVPAELTLEDESGDEEEFRFDVNYRRPFGESGSLRTGYSFRDQFDANARTLTFLEFADGGSQADFHLRGYERAEQLQSAFLTLQGSPREGVSLQVGLRAEHAALRLAFPSAEGVDRTDLNIFPSANLSWRIDRNRRLRLSYSQRVGRPGVSILDPTDRSTDPLQRNVGNPDIDPRITHRVNLNASWTTPLGTISLSPFLNRTTNGWERLTSVDPQGITIRSWDNLSSQTSAGSSANFSFRGIGSWRGSLNVNGTRSYRNADNLDPRYTGSSTSWGSRLNVNGTLVSDLTMQTSVRYRASARSLQGRDGSQTSLDLSFRYRFLDRRASASLSLQDPLGLQRSASEIRNPTIWEIRESTRDSRSARLSLSYSFGGGGAMRGRR